MPPVNSSASALTSGSSRQPASTGPTGLSELQNAKFGLPRSADSKLFAADTTFGSLTPGTCESSCQAGIAQDSEMPPPAAPHAAPSFQTCSSAGWVASSIVVPPAATTYGWLDGSSTERIGVDGAVVRKALQSLLPSSPAAEKTVWPWAAACSKISFSACWT